MNESILTRSPGTLSIPGSANARGELQLGETSACFVNRKGEELVAFSYHDIVRLKNVRNGGVSSTITVTLNDDSTFDMHLKSGLACHSFIDKHWPNKPRQVKSRADELRRMAELRGERIQTPLAMSAKKHRNERIAALVIALLLIFFDSGALQKLFHFELSTGFMVLINLAVIVVILILLGSSFKRRRPNRSIGGDMGIYFLLIVMACLMAFPLVFAIGMSLKPLDELFRFPPTVFPRHATFKNFSDLIVVMGESWVPFSRYLFNTVFITFVGTAGHLLLASMAAFVLAKYDFPGGRTFFGVVTTALMFSGYVTGIPNYVIMSKLGMIDTYWALLLPAFAAPIGLFLMKQFMEGLPTALIEAAHIDGAGEFRIFWSIVMPNVKPAWLTVMIFSVQSLWNTSASTVIYSEAKKTLVYALQQIQAGGIARTGTAAAVTVVVMIVPIILFIINQSRILETMASSGIKD